MAGWDTLTTRDRLTGLLHRIYGSGAVYRDQGYTCLSFHGENIRPWDGSWTTVRHGGA